MIQMSCPLYSNTALKFITLLLIYCVEGFDLTYEQFLQSTPSSFGLITVTYNPDEDYGFFKTHLNRYATMQCPQMTEIVIVWNNQKDPADAGFKQQQSWLRPVYFHKTPHNSMDFRYSLPSQSKARVFFSIDDDIITECSQLQKSFQIWKKNAVGDVAPLMGYGQRSFDFMAKQAKLVYSDQLKSPFYQLTLIGEAWVSRHYFELYNAQKCWEIQQFRQFVQDRNNCDDIALNYIVNYFYPEFVAIALDGNVLNKSPSKGRQSTSRSHYQIRNQCVKKFTEILGFNPMRIVDKNQDESQNRFISPLKKKIIYEKRKMLEEMLVLGEDYKENSQENGLTQEPNGQTLQNRQKVWSNIQKQLKQQIIAKTQQNRILELKLKQQNLKKEPMEEDGYDEKEHEKIHETKVKADSVPDYETKNFSDYESFMKLGCIFAVIFGLLILLQRITTRRDKTYQNIPPN